MQKIIISLLAFALLSGCVHKINIQQGNIIEQDDVSKLHAGMSKEEVRDIMGTPVLINTFSDNHVDYVYTNKPGYGVGEEKIMTLMFQGNRLKESGIVINKPTAF